MKLDGYPTCFLNIERGKKKFLAVGLSNGKVNIYDQKINLCQEIPPNGKIDEKENISKNDEQDGVASLSIEDCGEYLFIGYKNGVTMIIYLDFDDVNFREENIKQIQKNKYEINKILFDSKFFTIFFIGDNKGLKVKSVRGNFKYFEDNTVACYSICFDRRKNFLFAGFGDGNIRVYHLKW